MILSRLAALLTFPQRLSWGVWTTLGTEFAVSPAIRWLPLLQAATAFIFVPVLTSLLWEMLVEMTAPAGEAWNEIQERRRIEREVAAAKADHAGPEG